MDLTAADRGQSLRIVYLFRHAKARDAAAAPAEQGGDHARALTPAGAASALAMGAALHRRGADLGQVLCSTARRTLETFECAATVFPGLTASLDERLYMATEGQLLQLLQRVEDTIPIVTVVGHNPTLADLAVSLAGTGERATLASLAAGFPPGAIARLDFAADHWAEITPGAGWLGLYLRPKDL